MNHRENVEKFLEAIVDSISISDTMIDKAKSSYEAVGKWLGEAEIPFDIKIMPQGSFNLGTTIKPLSENEDYDIDLVCLIDNGSSLSDYDIKNIVGDRIKENKLYSQKLEPEGKRCWVLGYDEFHMDILPCVPEQEIFSEDDHKTDIHLTHKIAHKLYEKRVSNPIEYQQWFENRMMEVLNEAKKNFSVKASVEIKKVPTYKVKTPLQKAVQLLKRHRDKMFEKRDDAPISIIITTLAAQAYQGEHSLLDALLNITANLTIGIKRGPDGSYVILNPVLEHENFADKWGEAPQKMKNFFEWHEQLTKDITTLAEKGIFLAESDMKKSFGERPTQYAIRTIFPDDRISAVAEVSVMSPRRVNIEKPNRPFGDDLQ